MEISVIDKSIILEDRLGEFVLKVSGNKKLLCNSGVEELKEVEDKFILKLKEAYAVLTEKRNEYNKEIGRPVINIEEGFKDFCK